MFAADARGADVRILGCHWLVLPHGIYAKDSIKKVADLKGKTIAVSAPNSMPDMLARFALEKYGVDPKDVKLASVGGDHDRYNALVGGVVDAAVVSNEVEPVMPKSLHLLVAGRDAVPKFLRVLHHDQPEGAGREGRTGGAFPRRRDERAALRADRTRPRPWR